MKRKKKIVLIELSLDEWWPLSRYAAKENQSIRRISKQQLMPLIKEAKKQFPTQPPTESPSIDDVH